MATTKYSHAFLVGSFNGEMRPEQLMSNNQWKKVSEAEEYPWLCTMYYKGHLDAMLDVNDERPLKDISHYKFNYCEKDSEGNDLYGRKVVKKMTKNMGKDSFIYQFRVLSLHLYFFPFNTVLMAIELEDSGTELNELTAAHSKLVDFSTYDCGELEFILRPLYEISPKDQTNPNLGSGNKLKLYQVMEIDSNIISDELLYEIGTSSPIGCVGTNHQLAPSKTYFDSIMSTNKVSAFSIWKGLALMDSFTYISNGGKRDDWTWEKHFHLWNHHYFQLIYLRCLFEKTFCFSRNSAYRMGESTENLSQDIAKMERYYFYDKISYNFLPNLLYNSMSNGMELKEEREELSKQIKETTKKEAEEKKDKEERKRSVILALVSVFAVFSIIWDLCQIVKDAFFVKEDPTPARVFIGVAIALIVLFLCLIFWRKK